MFIKRFIRILAPAVAAFALAPAAIFAQPAPPSGLADEPTPQLVTQSPEFAAVRAKYENMTPAEVEAAGYKADPFCVSSPFGGMGYHAVNFALYGQQFPAGNMDPMNPPILLLDADKRVVGLEWEATKDKPVPTLFGYKVALQPAHPGVEEDHYMLHAYFKPNNQVLFAVFDPDLKCPAGGPGEGPGEGPGTIGMPRTGDSSAALYTALAVAAGAALLTAGATLRRRKA